MSERPTQSLKKIPTSETAYLGNVSDSTDSSGSDADDGVVGAIKGLSNSPTHPTTPDYYDGKHFESLDVPVDVKELFQHINRYTPQNIELDCRLRPFIPKFIPAVGDIDALLKVSPPAPWGKNNEQTTPSLINILGLEILDEPAGVQSEPTLLHMKLRSSSTAPRTPGPPVAVAKNYKDIDKWIHDIEALHATQPGPTLLYNRKMPDTDSLMQEWSGPNERALDEQGFPESSFDCSLSQYALIVCNLLDIPVPAPFGYKERLLTLHSLFTLYAAVRTSNHV